MRFAFLGAAVFCLMLTGGGAPAQDADTRATLADDLKPGELADKLIDQYVLEAWNKRKISPAPRSDTPEFMRRAYLDLIGVVPSVEEAREYLKNPASNKREKLIEELLKHPRYGEHWSDVWARVLIIADTRQGELSR